MTIGNDMLHLPLSPKTRLNNRRVPINSYPPHRSVTVANFLSPSIQTHYELNAFYGPLSTQFFKVSFLNIKGVRLELPVMDLNPPESEPSAGEDFVHIENSSPDPNAEDLSESIVNVEEELRNDSRVDLQSVEGGNSEQESGLPEELSTTVMVLTCDSTADGGKCDVYLVGTAHVLQESCIEVQAVISHLKPQVVFLELCASRVAALTLQTLKEPTMGEMVDMWKKKHNIFQILYSWFLAKVANKLEVLPGSEFRVAFEEAMKYGGKVILGDRPIQITLRRTWGRMPLWHKTKFLYSLLFQALFLPSAEDLHNSLKDMYDADVLTLAIQEMSKQFPTLMETLVHERDQYMASSLLKVASEHSSVVAVVGRGHLSGIKKHWRQPVVMEDLLELPSQKRGVSAVKVVSVGALVAGVAILCSIYLKSRK